MGHEIYDGTTQLRELTSIQGKMGRLATAVSSPIMRSEAWTEDFRTGES